MSLVSISYRRLEGASTDAGRVAKKLDHYADTIHSRVYQKLNNYGGSWSTNLSTASSKSNHKIERLREEASKYEQYSADLLDLKEQCVTTDRSVKSKISSLTATFRENHGIKNNPVTSAINSFLTGFKNETALGRWIGNGLDYLNNRSNHLKDAINAWLNLGGRDFLKGVAIAGLQIAIGAITIFLTGGAAIIAAATLITGVITLVNGIMNLSNEFRGLQVMDENPALAKRISNQDTIQDTLRKETDSRFVHGVATGMDFVSTAASIITLVGGGADLLKKGFQWTKGSTVDINTLKVRDILTKDNFRAFTGKLKTGFTDIFKTIGDGDWIKMKQTAKSIGTDFLNNIRAEYLSFKNMDSSLKSSKNIMSGTVEILKGDLNLKNLGLTGLTKVAVPNIPIAKLPGEPTGIKVDDFKISDIMDNTKKVKDLFSSGPIGKDVLDKLSNASKVNVSMTDFHIPKVNSNNIKVA